MYQYIVATVACLACGVVHASTPERSTRVYFTYAAPNKPAPVAAKREATKQSSNSQPANKKQSIPESSGTLLNR